MCGWLKFFKNIRRQCPCLLFEKKNLPLYTTLWHRNWFFNNSADLYINSYIWDDVNCTLLVLSPNFILVEMKSSSYWLISVWWRGRIHWPQGGFLEPTESLWSPPSEPSCCPDRRATHWTPTFTDTKTPWPFYKCFKHYTDITKNKGKDKNLTHCNCNIHLLKCFLCLSWSCWISLE